MKLLVVSPATDESNVTFWVSDSDPASHPEGDRDYREDEGLADAEARFGVPLTHALISR